MIISDAITSVYAVIAPWIPVTVVPTSFATVAIETFITELSSVIRNWPAASVARTSIAPAARADGAAAAERALTRTRLAATSDSPPARSSFPRRAAQLRPRSRPSERASQARARRSSSVPDEPQSDLTRMSISKKRLRLHASRLHVPARSSSPSRTNAFACNIVGYSRIRTPASSSLLWWNRWAAAQAQLFASARNEQPLEVILDAGP